MKLKEVLVRHPLAWFICLAYLFSWSIMIPIALQWNGVIKTDLPMYFHYVAAFGPMIAGIIMTWLTKGKKGLRDLGKRVVKWRFMPLFWAFVASPILIFLVIILAAYLVKGSLPGIQELGQVNYLPDLGYIVPLIWIFTFGIGEETGWRGFALPRLQKEFNALYSSLIIAGFWAIWHIPAFFYLYDPKIIPGFLVGLAAASIVFTWIYNSTGGSILAVALWHGLFNYTTACVECGQSVIPAIFSFMVILWAIVVTLAMGKSNLSVLERQKA